MTLNRARTIDRTQVGTNGFLRATVAVALQRRRHEEQDAFDRWRRYMVMVLDVAIRQCERRNLTAPVNTSTSDLRPPDLVVALIDELQVTHNLEVRFPRSNQHALDMLFALQHFYLAYADVDDAATEALGVRVAARGFAGYHPQELQEEEEEEEGPPESGFDWTAWFLAFKGVTLEGLEIAIIVVSFGASAGQLGPSILGGAAAIVVIGATGFVIKGPLERIPRSFLQLVVGTLLTSFGTFWALEGLGVTWPQSDGDIVLLLVFYALSAAIFIGLERRARRRLPAVGPARTMGGRCGGG